MIILRSAAAALLAVLLAALPSLALAQQAGKASFVRGITTAQGADGAARILATEAPLFAGDVLRTAANSYAVLQLADESKITLRPNTVFKVEAFSTEGEGSVLLRLFKGGLRTITGLVGQRNPRGFQLRSPVATIGIRGTDFEARLCEDDCRQEATGARSSRAPAQRVIGRVAFLSGELRARGLDGIARTLALGASLFEGDVLDTGAGAVAVVVFQDESRVTMRASSTLRLDKYTFDRDDPDKSSVAMNFLRGGIRVVSGLIARLRPERVRLATPVATIAVRGTGFELKCEDPCSAREQAAAPSAGSGLLDLLIPPASAQGTAGMTAFVFDGAIEFRLPGGTLVIDQGKAVFFDGVRPPVTLPAIPLYFQQASSAQQQVDAGTDQGVVQTTTTAPAQQNEAQTGLYVRVIKGDVDVTSTDTGQTALAGAGQTVFAQPQSGDVYRITAPRGVLPTITPSGELLTPATAPLLSPLPAGEQEPQTEFECVVQ